MTLGYKMTYIEDRLKKNCLLTLDFNTKDLKVLLMKRECIEMKEEDPENY